VPAPYGDREYKPASRSTRSPAESAPNSPCSRRGSSATKRFLQRRGPPRQGSVLPPPRIYRAQNEGGLTATVDRRAPSRAPRPRPLSVRRPKVNVCSRTRRTGRGQASSRCVAPGFDGHSVQRAQAPSVELRQRARSRGVRSRRTTASPGALATAPMARCPEKCVMKRFAATVRVKAMRARARGPGCAPEARSRPACREREQSVEAR